VLPQALSSVQAATSADAPIAAAQPAATAASNSTPVAASSPPLTPLSRAKARAAAAAAAEARAQAAAANCQGSGACPDGPTGASSSSSGEPSASPGGLGGVRRKVSFSAESPNVGPTSSLKPTAPQSAPPALGTSNSSSSGTSPNNENSSSDHGAYVDAYRAAFGPSPAWATAEAAPPRNNHSSSSSSDAYSAALLTALAGSPVALAQRQQQALQDQVPWMGMAVYQLAWQLAQHHLQQQAHYSSYAQACASTGIPSPGHLWYAQFSSPMPPFQAQAYSNASTHSAQSPLPEHAGAEGAPAPEDAAAPVAPPVEPAAAVAVAAPPLRYLEVEDLKTALKMAAAVLLLCQDGNKRRLMALSGAAVLGWAYQAHANWQRRRAARAALLQPNPAPGARGGDGSAPGEGLNDGGEEAELPPLRVRGLLEGGIAPGGGLGLDLIYFVASFCCSLVPAWEPQAAADPQEVHRRRLLQERRHAARLAEAAAAAAHSDNHEFDDEYGESGDNEMGGMNDSDSGSVEDFNRRVRNSAERIVGDNTRGQFLQATGAAAAATGNGHFHED